jgi:hypothetical protein
MDMGWVLASRAASGSRRTIERLGVSNAVWGAMAMGSRVFFTAAEKGRVGTSLLKEATCISRRTMYQFN